MKPLVRNSIGYCTFRFTTKLGTAHKKKEGVTLFQLPFEFICVRKLTVLKNLPSVNKLTHIF